LRGIALLGTIDPKKTDPKDVDILITIDDDVDLKALATAARRPKEQHKGRIEAPTFYL